MKTPEKTCKLKTTEEGIVHEEKKDKCLEHDDGHISQISACHVVIMQVLSSVQNLCVGFVVLLMLPLHPTKDCNSCSFWNCRRWNCCWNSNCKLRSTNKTNNKCRKTLCHSWSNSSQCSNNNSWSKSWSNSSPSSNNNSWNWSNSR